LADASGGKDTWRWRVFSFGAMTGIAFGAVYLAMPAITGAFLGESISFIAFPFKDLTTNVETFLPAFPLGIAFDLGLVISGMVLPFWAMVGSFIGLVVCIAMNPVLYKIGILKSWAPGLGAPRTIEANTLDFYFAFGLGLTAAIAVIGIWHIVSRIWLTKRREPGQKTDWSRLFKPPAGRGDLPLSLAIGIYLAVNVITIGAAWFLLRDAHAAGLGDGMTKLLLGVLCFYSFVYTPLVAYVLARLEGVVGPHATIPFVRAAAFMLSGYRGAALWFPKFPAHDYGAQAMYFRKTELTGTKITSMVKAELFIFPIVLIATVVFSHFIWRISAVPGPSFPYAKEWWELAARRQALVYSSTLPRGAGGQFSQSFHPQVLLIALAIALLIYLGLARLGLPVLLFYGIVRGLDQSVPYAIVPQFIGALLGRYYFAKKFGDQWKLYIVVFFAGYSC